MENEQDPQQEPQEKNKGGGSNPIDQINQGYKHARRLQKSFSQPKSGQNMLKMAQDPMGSLTSNIPGLGGKGGMKGLPKSPKQLKTIKNIAQVASKIPPHVWIAIGIILLILLVICIILMIILAASGDNIENSGTGSGGKNPLPNGQPFSTIEGFSLATNCSDELTNGSNADCQISYTYDSTIAKIPLESIIIFFDLPPNTQFVSATGNYTSTNTDKTYSWSLSDPLNQTALSFSITNTQSDIYADVAARARVQGFSSPGGQPASASNSCGGKYPLDNPLGNFGDPTCTFTKDQLYSLLRSLDPSNADTWYYKVVPCESSYDSTEHNPQAVDPAGAWGLFQMGRGLNGRYDHGDVPWQDQITNATAYNRLIGSPGVSGAYWWCAR